MASSLAEMDVFTFNALIFLALVLSPVVARLIVSLRKCIVDNSAVPWSQLTSTTQMKLIIIFFILAANAVLLHWKSFKEEVPLEEFLEENAMGIVCALSVVPMVVHLRDKALEKRKEEQTEKETKSTSSTVAQNGLDKKGKEKTDTETSWLVNYVNAMDKREKSLTVLLWLATITALLVFHYHRLKLSQKAVVAIPYSVVRQAAVDNNIVSITLYNLNSYSPAYAHGRMQESIILPDTEVKVENFSTPLPGNSAELLQLLNTSTEIWVHEKDDIDTLSALSLLMTLMSSLLLVVFLRTGFRNFLNIGLSKVRMHDKKTSEVKVDFSSVAGQESAKGELKQVVDFLKNPTKYQKLGAKVPKGILLVGPPGTGKTLLARAVAEEASVPFFSISGSEFVEMFVGVGASRVRDLFQKAREQSPSIAFIDEIDAVGQKRGGGNRTHGERDQTLNQLLAEMDGFDSTKKVIVIAATNRADTLDKALLRPGRFDRQITVEMPDKKGRLETLKVHTRNKPLAEKVDLETVAKTTIGFSGADIANLCNEAALNAAEEELEEITLTHFVKAFERIVLGNERPPLVDVLERKITAYHEAGHALTSLLVPEADEILKITITPRGQTLGVTAFVPKHDRKSQSKKYLMGQILVALGGRAAEELIFDDITTGAVNDLQRSTEIATRLVTQFGMSRIGQLNYKDTSQQTEGFFRNYSEMTAQKVDIEVQKIVADAYRKTFTLLKQNSAKLDKLAEALLDREVLELHEVKTLLGLKEPGL